ncbi:MAG: hypothetical protein M1818_005546 [Claussenomyces sp. TS43310]|nr:MAG: hypothetical protein M1818_005546 [Claussenomyces sp. TS43310]
MDSSTVTLDKAYFETLLRRCVLPAPRFTPQLGQPHVESTAVDPLIHDRAQFHTTGLDFTTPVHLPTVTVLKLDHDNLFLINDDSLTKNGDAATNMTTVDGTSDDDGAFFSLRPRFSHPGTTTTDSVPFGGNYTYGRTDNYQPRSRGIHDYNEYPAISSERVGEGRGDQRMGAVPRCLAFPRVAQRTVQLIHLPEGVTHAELVDVIRGGIVLEIYLRSSDRSASISFLEEEAAREFLHFVKKNDLYVRNRRIQAQWASRQYLLLGNVAYKLAGGATRNMVIRNASTRHTEESIRDHLEHIHNLVVIKISSDGQDVHISTNSVHNAVTARACMLSRAGYKGLKIEWDEDECAAPIKTPSPKISHERDVPTKKQNSSLKNRFALLSVDGADPQSQSEENSGIFSETSFSASPGGTAV